MPKRDLRKKTFKERYAPSIPFRPYLTHPLGRPTRIAEGYIYTQMERSIHSFFFHRGIDFEAPYGTPVYAAASGYAVAGYHRFAIRNSTGTVRTYKNKPIANGFGYFVQIYHPKSVSDIDGGRITQYGHLSSISTPLSVKPSEPVEVNVLDQIRKINRSKRENQLDKVKLEKVLRRQKRIVDTYPWVQKLYGFSFSDDTITSESYIWTPAQLKELIDHASPWVTWVEQGQEIGRVGTSAVFFGKPPYRENQQDPSVKKFDNTWDEIHLHFEEAARDPKTRAKQEHRDPFDIYKSKRWYTPANIKRSLFVQVPVR